LILPPLQRAAACYALNMISERLAEKIQRLLDEYLGAAGSAAIVSRRGEVMFESRTNGHHVARALAPYARTIAKPSSHRIDLGISAVSAPNRGPCEVCAYALALDGDLVLFVVAEEAVVPQEIVTRIERAARLLRPVLAGRGAKGATGGGSGGAPAELRLSRSNGPTPKRKLLLPS
jgi:hypothetical protein